MGLKVVASMSPAMASPPYKKFTQIYHPFQKLLGGTQTDKLVI
jgi:hypothetical protein